jgi:sugar O-acyltransferase (sialic acid O-acetyltransferase NeuD family)
MKAILLGYSGHGYVVGEAAILSGIELIGYAELKVLEQNPYGLAFLGDETKERFNWEVCNKYVLAVGANNIRAKIANRVLEKGGKCLSVIHPDASLAKNVQIGEGTFVARNVAVNPLVQIGDNVILNSSCTIDHECQISANVHIAPGAVLAGNVRVGEGSFIGANSVIREGVKIGKNVVIGAGSVILTDVYDDQVVVGNPAKQINR